ncbi:MAG: starch-binding protein [Muribaculaceae bacterium]|nr:starch-binding protein [Muribaculaceae bacterium]
MNLFSKLALGVCLTAAAGLQANATGWPADYQGVMLQGFYWDSYTDSKWTNLESQADELSQYFSLIWIPNSGHCGGYNNMGYMPQYWFTNHNSSFGTEAELLSMIQTYKAKGTGIIADVVINHRNGVTNWYDFPKEEWNGQTWSIGLEGICSNDEMAYASGQPKPTGAADTGENFDGCRDLDHTNANVQNNCKNYCKALIEKYGYTGFRYDMVKGYSGYYNKIYNQYSRPKFSVGEYWDGNYDAVAYWIEQTGKESAAFDFPGKYAINEAFHSNDMTKLVWKANGTTDQPAGLIHFGYTQYAVTFVDNHDTYRDGSKFNGNVVAANAFILMSPGTPCVFLPHYKQNKAAIQTLINIRNSVGIHNNSPVTVLRSSRDCYMAEITGKNGKAVVKIGSGMASPAGYSDSDIKASGNGYCVWTKTAVQGGGGGGGSTVGGDTPSKLYILGNLAQGSWKTNVGVTMTKSGDKFTANDVELVAVTGETKAFFTFVTALGTTGASTEWDTAINGSDRYGATTKDAPISVGGSAAMQLFAAGVDASSAYSWGVEPGKYTITADFSNMTVSVTKTGESGGGGNQGGGGEVTEGNWVYFDNSATAWTTPHIYYWPVSSPAWPGVAMSPEAGAIWKYQVPEGTTGIIFNAGDGDATKTADLDFVAGHLYDKNGDKGAYTGNGGGGGGGGETGDAPSQLYILGNLKDASWVTSAGIEMVKEGNNFVARGVVLTPEAGATTTSCYFTFVTALGADWDAVNMGGDRYGAPAKDTPLTPGQESPMTKYTLNVNASAAESWMIPAGTYTITANFTNMTVKAEAGSSAVEEIVVDSEATPVYYNLMGIRVDQPTPGLYIVVRGNKVTKEFVR